jgi:O-acetyl-ADP-ribose deacetylase (regulator of RNase III)
MKLSAICSDITTLEVDMIVNAANKYLMDGSGVDGAIHGAAGPELLAECKLLGGCAVGHTKLTKAYNLPAKHVIHTVGPRWIDGGHGEPDLNPLNLTT